MRLKKSIFALVAILLSFTFSANAQVTTESALKTAIEAGGDIVLGGDIEVTTEIQVPAGVTASLDLAGYKITSGYQAGSDSRHIYPLNVYGDLTIKDSKGEGSITGRGIFVQAGCRLTVESGSIYGIDSNGGSALFQYGGDIVINGGHIEQNASGTSNFAIYAQAGTVTVYGGWVGGNHGAISAGDGATVVIYDGTFVCTGTSGMTDNVLYSYASGTITINGGVFIADADTASGGCCVCDANGGTTVNGGNFSNSSGGDVWGTTGTTINGGTFENLIETGHVTVGATITNGGVTYTKTEDGLEEVTETSVATYDELVAALANGGQIKLTADITVNTRITAIDGTVIDLNDKTLYVNVENSYYNNVTIKNGNIVIGKDDVNVCDGYFLVNAGKTLVLNDVNVSSSAEGIKGYAVFHLRTGANLDLINSTLNIADNEYSEGYIVYAGEATATLDVVNSTITGSKVNGVVHATTVIDESTITLTNVVEHGINRSGVTIDDSNVTISGGTGRGITAQHGDLVITGNSTVNITDMGEATIELRNDKNLSVADEATVTVDVAVNNTSSGTITGTVVTPISGLSGEGTEASPYLVTSKSDLAWFASDVNGGNNYSGKYVQLVNDIDLAGEAWTPIGNNINKFEGFFDGNEKTISNLKVSSTAAYVGFFGYIKGTGMSASNTPSVKDLKLVNVDIQSTGYYVGGLSGQGYTCNITNVSVQGKVAGNRYVGGLVGHVYTYFKNCSFEGEVTCTFDALGGIAGAGDCRAYDCSVIGTVSGSNWVGGIVGNGQEGTSAVGCYVKATVSTSTNFYRGVGGIAGVAGHGYESSEFKNNYFDGEVYLCDEKVDAIIAGFVNADTNADIKTTVEGNSWNTQYYSAETPAYVVGTEGLTSNATADAWVSAAVAEKTTERNNNLVMLESDLQYVDAKDVANVTKMSFSTVADDAIAAKVAENNLVAQIGDVKYASLNEALAAATDGQTITLLSDVEESITAIENVTLVSGVQAGVTVTSTYTEDYINFNNVIVGNGVTLNLPNVYSSGAGSVNTLEGTLNVGGTYYHSSNAKTTIQNGGKVTTVGMTVMRYNTNADAGIYIYGDNNDETVEFSCGNTIGAYSGTLYAKDAVINANMIWLDYKKNDNEESDTYSQINANFVNTKINVTSEFRLYKDASLTLDGATVSAGKVQVRENATPVVSVNNSTINATTVENLSGASLNAVLGANGTVTFAKPFAKVGTKVYYSLADALDEATAGQTITLLAPITIAAGETLEIDLAGRTIEYTSSVAGEDMITNYGTLTINDSSAEKAGKITYNNTDTSGNNVTVSTITNNPKGLLTVNGGTIENTSSNANAPIGKIFPFAIDNVTNGTLGTATTTINGGTIKSTYRSIRLFANSTSDSNTVNITAGDMQGQVWLQAPNTQANNVTLSISGGKFAPAGNDYSSVFVTTSNGTTPEFNVTGGEFSTKIGTDNATLACNDGISGGTFTAEAMQSTSTDLIKAGYMFKENVDGTYGVVVSPVAKIGDVEYATLQDAINAVQAGETITLLSNVTVTEPAFGQNALNHNRAVNFTLDLNGKTLSADTGNSLFRFNIAGSGATSNVTITIKNGKVVSGENTWCTLMSSGIEGAKAIMNLEDLIVENSKGGDLAIKAWANGVVNAKNVTVNSTYGGGFYALGGEIVLDNCKVTQKGLWTAPYLSVAVGVSNGGKLTVNSGTYSVEPLAASDGNNQGTSHGSWCGAVMSSGGTLIINGGTFSNANYGDVTASYPRELFTVGADADYGDNVAALLQINGGTFNSIGALTHCETIWGSENDPANTYMPTMNIEITGGIFTGVTGRIVGGNDPISNNNPVEVEISGGTYNANHAMYNSYFADGYVALPTIDGNYMVGKAPTATVHNLGSTTVPAGDYVSYPSGGNATDMPLSFVMQFLADESADEVQNSAFKDWYGDFVITFTGIANDSSFVADGCYLAGHYGSFGWVKVPVDGMTIEEGARYPVMLSALGGAQTYETICTSVKDFKCALYLTPEVLAENPNLEVKLELSVIDSSNGVDAATEALVAGENIYEVVNYEYEAIDFALYEGADVVIEEGTLTSFSNPNTITTNSITYKRALYDDLYWNPLYVPFQIPVSEFTKLGLEVAYFNDVHSEDTDEDGVLNMFTEFVTIKSGTLRANYPYLFRRTSDASATAIDIKLDSATLYSTSEANQKTVTVSSAFVKFDVKGTYTQMSASDLNGGRVLGLEGDWGTLHEDHMLKPFRVYLNVTILDDSPVVTEMLRSIQFRVIDGDMEGATGVTTPDSVEGDDVVYDLQGRRVLEPENGIYIVNGKKVIFK